MTTSMQNNPKHQSKQWSKAGLLLLAVGSTLLSGCSSLGLIHLFCELVASSWPYHICLAACPKRTLKQIEPTIKKKMHQYSYCQLPNM